MKKRFLIFIHIFCAILLLGSTLIVQAQYTKPEGRRLRTIVEEKYNEGNFYIGSASHAYLLSTSTAKVLAEEFSYITPANKFKQSYIHPEPGKWQWEDADNWVKYAADNNQVIRLHAPISPQCSKWAKNDDRTAGELKQMLEEYMTAICKRYNDSAHIKWLDVVNETLNDDGTWFGPKPGDTKWENPWPVIGFDNDTNNTPLYIKYAFEIADSLAPDLKLIINQHGSMADAKWDKIKATVMYLRNIGLRVDGIGWQAHVDAGWEKVDNNVEKLKSLIEWAHANNLEFHVTENNSWLKSWEWDTEQKRETNFIKQGETFAAIVRTLLPYRETGVVTWNLWHIEDDQCQGYKWDKSGCLWTTDGVPKLGYYMVQRVLEIGTDSVRHNVNLKIVDSDSQEVLHDFEINFNGNNYSPDENGNVSITGLLAGNYPVSLSKQHYEDLQYSSLYVYKDTSVEYSASRKKYKVTVHAVDSLSGDDISSVNIETGGDALSTSLNGLSTFELVHGEYRFAWEKDNFQGNQKSVTIESDTTITIYLNPVTSIIDNSFDKLTIYPNPSDDVIFIESGTRIFRCQLFDIQGKQIAQEEIFSSKFKIDVSNLNAGMYILKIQSNRTQFIRNISIL